VKSRPPGPRDGNGCRSALASDPVLGKELPSHSGLTTRSRRIWSTSRPLGTSAQRVVSPPTRSSAACSTSATAYYALLVATLQVWFDHENELFGIRSQALATMTQLDEINRMLVERGLLPSSTL
jgi:hypothetical protein